ncbi:hypothetical protein [Streptomyces sp. HD]|uniref:hypothetical protein n=1 Tax=Streptomyces sp. HD TaxID=3020892 RepID=UPI00232B12F9|nr:hypothetical protein [Streptomyces sp. HD]MDC0769857.1 hypothetical protein [Streptomyces sp. HD]
MRAPRTLRTALVATGVTAALGVSAVGAFAADTPAKAPVKSVGQVGQAGKAAHHSKAERVHVKTVKLADKVSRAKLYRTGEDRYEAEIWVKGRKYGALYTDGRAAARAQNNGLHVTLHPNGKVTSWIERAKPKPQPKPVVKRLLVATPTLADGVTTAKVYRLATHHYEADIFADGVRLDTLVANGRAAYGENNGLKVVLKPDGQLISGFDETTDPATTPSPGTDDQLQPEAG